MHLKKLFIPILLCIVGCGNNLSTAHDDIAKDFHSFAEPNQVRVSHLDLKLNVDFKTQTLTGLASWTIEHLNHEARSIVFDSRHLTILKVTSQDTTQALDYTLGKEDTIMGQALSIAVNKETQKVNIWYKTSKDAAALQWLTPQQTAGKKYPFLYTQSEAILARTWIPCQDSPGIRFSYDAEVNVPANLLALMSAKNPTSKSPSGKYVFKQQHPIPSYLMALAVGDIDFKSIDKRTGIYAEPVSLKKAAWEFADMGKMVHAAEKLYGPYSWGRYDVLVLPPSFPFGGMENPVLTFATPTAIAGDRSLVSLIAHELAHSWSGNLVTNATWNDFWLNEGFTTYFERRIVEEVYGQEEAAMQEVIAHGLLREAIDEMGATNKDTRLKEDFNGRDPDEGMTDIAYEKGYFFLRKIEATVGRKDFDAFLKSYFSSHAFRSITTEDFLAYLKKELLDKHTGAEKAIDTYTWIHQPGIPGNIIVTQSKKFAAVDSCIASWKRGIVVSGLHSKFETANELIYFIKNLPKNIDIPAMKAIDEEFDFTSSQNAEVQFVWYMLAVKKGYTKAYPNIETFLESVGRRKFVEPLYRQMSTTPQGKAWAKRIYVKARGNYHSVTYHSIDAFLM